MSFQWPLALVGLVVVPVLVAAYVRRERRRADFAARFTTPGLLFQFFFGWFPVLIAFVVGFQRYYFVKPAEYVGLQNFQEVFSDALTYEALTQS